MDSIFLHSTYSQRTAYRRGGGGGSPYRKGRIGHPPSISALLVHGLQEMEGGGSPYQEGEERGTPSSGYQSQ